MYGQITPQMAQAELARRAAIVSGQSSMDSDPNAVTPEMAKAELARRGIDINQPMQQPSQQQSGIASIPGDIGNLLMQMYQGVGTKVMQLPGEINSGFNQVATNPMQNVPRAVENTIGGSLEAAKQSWNLPFELGSYLDSKFGLNNLANTAKSYVIGNTGLQNAVMGQPKPGDQLFQDIGSVAPLFTSPETIASSLPESIASKIPESITSNLPGSIASQLPAVTRTGIMDELSAAKASKLAQAKAGYGQLFNDAAAQGLTHAFPPQSVIDAKNIITQNSANSKWTQSFQDYLKDPTLENAHWAQSDLGSMVNNLKSLRKTRSLSAPETDALSAAANARDAIKQSMFSNNALGSNSLLGLRYKMLSQGYKANVVPYTRLQPLWEYENGELTPKTAINNVLNDEKFKLNLINNHPGIYLHTPMAKKILWGAAGIAGATELKKLLTE